MRQSLCKELDESTLALGSSVRVRQVAFLFAEPPTLLEHGGRPSPRCASSTLAFAR